MKMNQIGVVVAILGGAVLGGMGQSTSRGPLDPPVNGVRRTDPGLHVFMGATIHPAPGVEPRLGLFGIRGDQITQVSPLVSDQAVGSPVPGSPGATSHDMTGLHIYPGLIESFVEVHEPQTDDGKQVTHWNPMVTPHHVAVQGAGLAESEKESLRKLGFVAAHITPETGVFRGLSGVVSLGQTPGDASQGQVPVYRDHVGNVLSFDRTQGQPDGSGYPVSHMGAMALVRQTLIDSDWQRAAREAGEEIPFNGLDAIIPDLPLIFDVGNPLHALLADGVGDEFERDVIVIGDGREYQHLEAIAGEERAMIVPLRFPAEPDVSSVGMIEALSLEDLMAWEQAPMNVRRLIGAGLEVAITSSKVDGRGKFHKNLRKAIEHGLDEQAALAALTTTPAAMLGVGDRLGTLAVGKVASFIVADGPLFEEKTKILEVWIDGQRHEINKPRDEDIAGRWSFTFGMDPMYDGVLAISVGDKGKVKVVGESKDPEVESIEARNVQREGRRLSYVMDNPDASGAVVGTILFAGDRLFGTVLIPGGMTMEFTGQRLGDVTAEGAENAEEEAGDEEESGPDVPEVYGFPFGGYGVDALPEAETALFVNATVWTSGPDGILEDGWVMVENGKIARLGTGVPPRGRPNMRIIDCEGRHITPGLIDAHSHTGLFAGGVNEGSQACTSEVRIHDSLDPSHINWYRQLAAGVTTVNSLHGSANPIGGQNAIHKVRWGSRHPRDMLMQGAKPGIKFALGENVKQSNWGNEYTVRYPQSRMGVETFIRDRFLAAEQYAADQYWAYVAEVSAEIGDRQSGIHEAGRRINEHGSAVLMLGARNAATSRTRNPPRPLPTSSGPVRRDLELEALAEILAGDRLIHCHSYRQDEILMLCRVAEEFGFKIGSFQHVLEGYKVAEAIREHALGASCFSDWWAYKVEVQDAIPYNGPIMHAVGVVVSYNSDSDELSRRLNTEVAKAVKYGGIEPAEALKFVTLNPAIQLAIDDRVGSLEVGKDADLAIWSGDPLSSLSVCEATWIDGWEYFSLEEDAAHRERNEGERQRILAKLLKSDKKDDEEEKIESEGDAKESDDPDWLLRDHLSLEWLDNLAEADHDLRGDCGCTADGWLHRLMHE